MKILVTGGAGYIGSTICSALEDGGHVPVILDSLVNGRREFTAGRAFYHGDIAALKGGFLGVEVFFVISGYLITSLLLAERKNTMRLDLRRFYARRAKRLLPALPILFAARALLRFVRDSDELQRRIQLEAFALASLVLTLGSFALGLLVLARVIDIAAGDALVMVLPAYALLY
ncbi:MAG TPA: NAD-dependent epimerase/dehydratase family protein, partial [Armatimonadota bacterium]|nr:NAD-dependent epimerase/dehydratase family protein [Armatimonadota bacterium]